LSRLLSSEITAIRVPTLWLEGEGHVSHSVLASYGGTCAESKNLACVEAFCTRIGIPVNFPVLKNWNGRIQWRKISCGHGVSGCVLSRHERRTRNQGANTGWGGEGVNPYVHLIMFHGSRTTTYYLRSRRTMGTCRPSGACGGKDVDREEHHEEHHSRDTEHRNG